MHCGAQKNSKFCRNWGSNMSTTTSSHADTMDFWKYTWQSLFYPLSMAQRIILQIFHGSRGYTSKDFLINLKNNILDMLHKAIERYLKSFLWKKEINLRRLWSLNFLARWVCQGKIKSPTRLLFGRPRSFSGVPSPYIF